MVGSLAACDQGEQHVQPTWGPSIHLVAANVGPTQSLPADGTIQLAFDRLLLPATAIRQSFILIDANQNALEPLVQYDPVTRVVSISNPNTNPDGGSNGGSWLNPGQPYSVYLGVAKYGDDESGVRAIDGAPLSQPVQVGFLVGAPTGKYVGDAPTNFCNDVWPIFTARCSLSQCHGSPSTLAPSVLAKNPALAEQFPDGKTQPAAGLILDTSIGVAATAINRVAQGSNTGPYAHSDAPGPHFGFDMPIIDPGDPANSWLMYKLLLATVQPDSLEADAGTPTNGQCNFTPTTQPTPLTSYEALSDDERAVLSNYVLGQPMPYPQDPATPTDTTSLKLNLTIAELERVRAWIAGGAVVNDCSVCSQ